MPETATEVGGSQLGGQGTPPVETTGQPRTPFTQQLGRIIVVAAAILFLVFAFANSQPVTFNWIFGEAQAVSTPEGVVGGVPLILLLLVAFLLGALVGAGLLWRIQRARQAPAGSPGRAGPSGR